MQLESSLREALTANDTLILTANKRLSRWLLLQARKLHTENYFPAPYILPLQTWLEKSWQEALTRGATRPKRLLTPEQSQLLWLQIIESELENPLLDLQGTAKMAEQAWRLMHDWQISLADDAFLHDHNGEQFQRWAEQFQKKCEELSLLDLYCLTETILTLIADGTMALPKKIILIGFIEFTPIQQALINTLKKHGTAIELITHHIQNSKAERIACTSEQQEIETMAAWAKQTSDASPNKTIACIIPNLNQCRDSIERAFKKRFQDESCYNISSGNPLTKEPIIHAAFSLLTLNKNRLDYNKLSHLLRSPFITNFELQQYARAKLDAKLREAGKTTIEVNDLIDELGVIDDETLKKSFESLKNFTLNQKLLPSKWRDILLSHLHNFGWPGDRPLNSREYQTLGHFETALNKLNMFDAFLGNISFYEAKQQLQQLCYQTLFQPQTAQANVQVLGLFETSGLLFDAIWVMGMDHQQWPNKATPNPFIPLTLQREKNIAHASAEREFQFCEKLTEQLRHQANEILFSYSRFNKESPLAPSPLIADLAETVLHDTHTPLSSLDLELFDDKYAPCIQPNENIRGGTSILKFQANCPFQAFAKIRLKSESIDEPEIGLNAAEQGTLAHRALELFWKTIRTQQTLSAKTENALRAILTENIDTALRELKIDHLPSFIIDVEKERLLSLLMRWLVIEKARPAFSVIELETWQTTQIDRLTVHMKADRLDEIGEDRFELIDYKTGLTSKNSWLGDRLDEPQLPLYAISAKRPIVSIAFAQLKSNQLRYDYVSDEKLPKDENVENWQELLELWRRRLTALAKEFCDGDASVNPKDCRYCNLQTLCRIK